MKKKTCNKCGERKSISRFYKRYKLKKYRRSQCIKCIRKEQNNNYKHSHKIITPKGYKKCPKCSMTKKISDFAKNKTSNDKLNPYCRECTRVYQVSIVYKIDKNAYTKLESEHNKSCAICKTPEKKLSRKLDIDHDHRTNKNRGLLCGKCNKGIGMFNDDPNLLRAAADYLDKWYLEEETF